MHQETEWVSSETDTYMLDYLHALDPRRGKEGTPGLSGASSSHVSHMPAIDQDDFQVHSG